MTPAQNVHALGVIFYRLVTGQFPFKGATVMDAVKQVMTMAPQLPSRVRKGLPCDLDLVCMKCLEKQPERRYPTTEALAEDLRHWLTGPSPGVVRRVWRRTARFARR
jgi:serine/threonine protein kinase